MFPDQPMGLAIQLSRGQKKGAASTVHPISGSLALGSGVSRLIIASNASRDSAPFFLSNTSQASDRGSVENLTNHPPPAMWLYGRLSLNKRGAPGSSPTKGGRSTGLPEIDLVYVGAAQKGEPVGVGDPHPQPHRDASQEMVNSRNPCMLRRSCTPSQPTLAPDGVSLEVPPQERVHRRAFFEGA